MRLRCFVDDDQLGVALRSTLMIISLALIKVTIKIQI
jgi:hypothetical protein